MESLCHTGELTMKVRITYEYTWEGVVEIDDVESLDEAKELFYEAAADGELDDTYRPEENPAGGYNITEIEEVK